MPLLNTKVFPSLLVLLFLVTATGCAKIGASGEPIATVEGTVITKGDYDKLYNQFLTTHGVEANNPALRNPLLAQSIKSQVMQILVVKQFLENDANKLGIAVTEGDVRKAKDKFLQQFKSSQDATTILSANHISDLDLDDRLREEVLARKFLAKLSQDMVHVSEDDAKAYYEDHKTEYFIPETVHSYHILVKAIDADLKRELRKEHPNASEAELGQLMAAKKADLKEKAETIYKDAQAHPDQFAALAHQYSEDPGSASQGGDLGNLTENGIIPAFWDAIKNTRPNSFYPGVLETPFGYHIVMVKGHTAARFRTYDEVRDEIVNKLEDEGRQKVMQVWQNEKIKEVADQNIVKFEPGYDPTQMQQPQGIPVPQSPSSNHQASSSHQAKE